MDWDIFNLKAFDFILYPSFWGWMALAFVFITIELLVAKTWTLWLGFSACLIALLKLFLIIPYGWDWVLFIILSIFALLFANKFFWVKSYEGLGVKTTGVQGIEYVGQIIILTVPIENKKGKVFLDGVWWSLKGEDLPAGSKVRIVGLEEQTLKVESFDNL